MSDSKPKITIKAKVPSPSPSPLPDKDTTICPKPKITIKAKVSPPSIPLPPKGPLSLNEIRYYPSLFNAEEATNLFQYLKTSIKWEAGIRSRNGPTRLAKAISLDDDPLVQWAIVQAFMRMGLGSYVIFGLYLNYYRNGTDYTPSHRHKDTVQLVISLNEPDGERSLTLDKVQYPLKNGDAIIFGDQSHGIPKVSNCGARISLATFMRYEPSLGGRLAFLS